MELHELATAYGIATSYEDMTHKTHTISDKTLRTLLKAMGVGHIGKPEQAMHERFAQQWCRRLEPVQVIQQDALGHGLPVTLTIPQAQQSQAFEWLLTTESGETFNGAIGLDTLSPVEAADVDGTAYARYALTLPVNGEQLPWGYHTLQVKPVGAADADASAQQVIVTLSTCYTPPVLENNGRIWGPGIQLYSLRSERDWGIGDFSDLKHFFECAAKEGAALVGVNPLHTLNLQYPAAASPYSPVSRNFLSPLYIDVETIPEFAEWKASPQTVMTPAFEQHLEKLRRYDTVHYQAVADAKFTVLTAVFDYFSTEHLAKSSPRAQAFRQFQQEQGEMLRQFALFQALQAHFEGKPWFQWDSEYQDIYSPAVQAFAQQHADRVTYFAYLQWLADTQLKAVNLEGNHSRLAVGLYRDLAIGSEKGGFDVWANRSLYTLDANVGAPPDPLGPNGQDWGLPPFIPHKLRDTAYRPLIEVFRRNMRHAGALRIDHVAGLNRLFWIPVGEHPKHGAYVHYPFEDILGILALESHRNRCLIIGEDLGTVPPVVHDSMLAWKLLSYKVARWEKGWNDALHAEAYKEPHEYPRVALVSFSTHDTSTLRGLLTGWLFRTWERLGIVSHDICERLTRETAQDNRQLIDALQRRELLPADITLEGLQASLNGKPSGMVQEFVGAVHRFMAQTPSSVVLYQLEDLLQVEPQVNIPGTGDADTEERHGGFVRLPNWRNRLPLTIGQIQANPGVQAVMAVFREERGRAQ